MDRLTSQYYYHKLSWKLINSDCFSSLKSLPATTTDISTNLFIILLTFVCQKLCLKTKNVFSSPSSGVKKSDGTKPWSRIPQLCAVLILLLKFSFFIQPVQPASHPIISFEEDFTYSQNDLTRGPTAWQGECTTGRLQSPIDIRYKEFGASWGGFTQFSFNREYYKTQNGFFATNPGHTFQIQFNDDRNNPTSDMVFSGAGFHKRYTFAQLHFHWGDRDEIGSEHTLQGQRLPMEIHMVHYKSKYGNLSNALHENSRDHEAVAVLAILCELGDENPGLSPIIAAAASTRVLHPTTELIFNYQNINLLALLPRELDFVRYLGSLTTPPCTEKVAWTIFLCPSTVSRAQLDALRKLRDTTSNDTYYNYRPLQPRNGRKLKHYKVFKNGVWGSGNSGWGNTPEEGSWSSNSISPVIKIKETITNTLTEVNSLISNFLYNLCKRKYCVVYPEEEPEQNSV